MPKTDDFARRRISYCRVRRYSLVDCFLRAHSLFSRAFPLIASCAIVPSMKAILAARQIEFVCDLWPRTAELRVWLNRLNAAPIGRISVSERKKLFR